MSEYYHILNKEETKIFFNHLSMIYDRIIELELHTKKLKKRFGKRGLRSNLNSARGG